MTVNELEIKFHAFIGANKKVPSIILMHPESTKQLKEEVESLVIGYKADTGILSFRGVQVLRSEDIAINFIKMY